MQRAHLPLSLLSVLLLASLAACSSSGGGGTSGGPIDGAYVISGWSCGSTNVLTALSGQGVSSLTIEIANTTGTLNLVFSATCTETNTDAFAYSSSPTTVTLTEGAVTCSAGCTSQCTAGAGSGRTDAYAYAVSGATTSLTRTLTSAEVSSGTLQADVGCTAGSTETITLEKMP